MANVVITDYTFPSLDVETDVLAPLGHAIVAAQCKSVDQLVPLVENADAVITQFAPVNAEVVAAMRRARVIVRYGIGVDNVDLEAARKRGIPVCNVPDYCIDEVADHTLAFLLAITRQVVSNTLYVRSGQWGMGTPLPQLKTLRDLVVGCVGFGRIGRAVLARLEPLRCHRLACDPAVPADAIVEAGCEPVSWDRLLKESDVVTLHCPSTPSTRRMLNEASFSRLKRGAIVLNLSRGDLIDTQALVTALTNGRLGAAGLDVCDPEPIPLDSPLRSMPNVILSSHIASASVKAVATLRGAVARIAATALAGETPPNIVNGVTRGGQQA